MNGTKKLEAHPAADVFPMMSDDELNALAKDIVNNGQRQHISIVVVDGESRILDGRNRYEACRRANVQPKTQVWRGEDPFAFVVSANLQRRHLTESQRALIAEEIAVLKNGANQYRKEGLPAGTPTSEASVEEAAKLMNVSPRQVFRARRVKKLGAPALVEAVKLGAVSLRAAAEVAKETHEEQVRLLSTGTEAVVARANPPRRPETDTRQPPRVVHDDGAPSPPETAPRDVATTTKTGRERKNADSFGMVKKLTEEGFTVADIVERTGFTKNYIHTVRREILPRRGILDSFTRDVEAIGETWDAHANDFVGRWGHASTADREPLIAALEFARKAASRLIHRLKKEGALEREIRS